MFLMEDWLIIVLSLAIVVPIFILMIVAIAIAIHKRGKYLKKPKQNNNQITRYYALCFGENNILDVEMEMSRVTVTVKDIDLVDANKLKELGANGVLLVGNKIKCSFDDATSVYEVLKGEKQ